MKKKIVIKTFMLNVILLVLTISWGGVFGQNLTVAEALLQRKQVTNKDMSQPMDKDNKNILAITTSSSTSTEEGYYQEPKVPDRSENDNAYLMLWIRLIVIMGIFCGAAYLLLRYLKKRGVKQNEVDQHLFQRLGEFPLGVNKKIQIVKILNDFYILALGQDKITLLSKVEDKESIDILKLENSRQPNQNFFEDSLKNYLNIGGWSPLSMTRGLKKRIKGM